jgi:Fe-S cluster biosynthesis and repair protein YggX
MRTVDCQHFKQDLPGLEFPPFPGEIGDRIFEGISKQAWDEWLAKQTILINEYRLDALDSKTQDFLDREMLEFLFDDGNKGL